MHMGRMWGISLLRRSWAISLLQRRWGISLLWRTWGISLGEREASAYFGQREAPHFSGEREASPFFGNVRNLPSLGTWGISLLGEREASPFFRQREAPHFSGERGHLPSSENVRNLTPFAGRTCPRAAGRTLWERESRLSALAVQGHVGDKWPHETWPLAGTAGNAMRSVRPSGPRSPTPAGPCALTDLRTRGKGLGCSSLVQAAVSERAGVCTGATVRSSVCPWVPPRPFTVCHGHLGPHLRPGRSGQASWWSARPGLPVRRWTSELPTMASLLAAPFPQILRHLY